MDERKCKECAHYIVKDTKNNYCTNGCGTYTQKIYGCELWECKFKGKEDTETGKEKNE